MFNFLDRLFCRHENVKKRRPMDNQPGVTVLYVVCILCGKESDGVQIGKQLIA